MAFNVDLIRKDFPSLATGIAFFDGPGGSQVPVSVGGAIAKAITQASSNRGTITLSEQNAKLISHSIAVKWKVCVDSDWFVFFRSVVHQAV